MTPDSNTLAKQSFENDNNSAKRFKIPPLLGISTKNPVEYLNLQSYSNTKMNREEITAQAADRPMDREVSESSSQEENWRNRATLVLAGR